MPTRPAARPTRVPAQAPTRTTYRCYAVAAPGVESLTAAELRPLVSGAATAEPGGVAFDASREELYRANLWLRTASRVLVRLAEFEAVHFAELQEGARAVDWSRVVAPGRPVRLRVTCRKSRLYHSDAVAERVGDAIRDQIGGDVTTRAAGSDEADESAAGAADDAQLVVVRLFHDRCTLSADSSGALLHRRGYRQALGKAPLRETLAAAMLLASGYDGSAPLLDPLCGSGTIAIEGALIARRLAPGRHRDFAFERWPDFDPALWRALRARADAGALSFAPAPIVASDRDAGAVEAARSNAERAGVDADLAVARHALSSAEAPTATNGWLVTNPPYGKRLGEPDALRDLWARLGQFARVRCAGWRAAVLLPDLRLASQLGLAIDADLRTSNGGLPVHIGVGNIESAGD